MVRRPAVLGLALIAAASAAPRPNLSVAHATAVEKAAPTPATLAVAHGALDGTTTEVGLVTIGLGSGTPSMAPLGSIDHVKGSAIRGAVSGATVLVTAEEPAPKGTSYPTALHRIDGGARRLCGGLTRATGPLVVDGHVLVSRGLDGPEPLPGPATESLTLRIDTLTLDEVDPTTGATRTVWTGAGYQAFLAGALGREAIVYLSQPSGATLFALDVTTLATRTLGVVEPFARDFSVDVARRALVFANGTPTGRWQVESLDTTTFARTVLFASRVDHPMPFALSSGDVVLSSDGDHGLLRLARAGMRQHLLSPAGDGSDAATHEAGRWLAVRHTPTSRVHGDRAPTLIVVDADTGQSVPIVVPKGHVVDALGFLRGGAS